jgi:hypothetical protein
LAGLKIKKRNKGNKEGKKEREDGKQGVSYPE